MTKPTLREVLRGPIVALSQIRTHKDLPELCGTLGLPLPDTEDSKRVRMEKSFDAATDLDLKDVAGTFLRLFPPTPDLRNKIQDLSWADMNIPEIPKRFRRELARDLGQAGDLYEQWGCFEDLLNRLWILDDDPFDLFGINPSTLRRRIRQHVMQNPRDWTSEYLFETLGAFECSDQRFALFVEGLACADVLPDVAAQGRFVAVVNKSLGRCGAELRETATKGGYPVFSLCWRTQGAHGKAKNLIFASQAKPDLRFRDAVNNDIEIVSNSETVLIYDEPIPEHGLLWSDLQTWWANRNGVVDMDAKRTLYKRLLTSLLDNSPPQRFLFQSYFKSFRETIPYLPALLPEVCKRTARAVWRSSRGCGMLSG